MHRSRLAAFIFDCRTKDVTEPARFWSSALGMPTRPEEEGGLYVPLDASSRDLAIEVQRVDHESRIHVDIESDDVEAEVRRLEALGAKRVAQVKTWWVLEAPTGQRFCVIRAKKDLTKAAGVNTWNDDGTAVEGDR